MPLPHDPKYPIIHLRILVPEEPFDQDDMPSFVEEEPKSTIQSRS
jgi:hypothetical protein